MKGWGTSCKRYDSDKIDFSFNFYVPLRGPLEVFDWPNSMFMLFQENSGEDIIPLHHHSTCKHCWIHRQCLLWSLLSANWAPKITVANSDFLLFSHKPNSVTK